MNTFDIHAKYGKELKKLIPNRKPTRELLDLIYNERLSLFNSLIHGDGSIKEGRNGTISYVFYQSDINTLKWFMELCTTLGFRSTLNKKKMYVGVSTKQDSMIQRNHFGNTGLKKERYNGMVWCVNTNLGNIVIKRNNKISVTGNSGLPANLAGIQNLKNYMAGEIGVKDGEMVVESKGLHLYGYAEDLAKMRCMKEC